MTEIRITEVDMMKVKVLALSVCQLWHYGLLLPHLPQAPLSIHRILDHKGEILE